MMIIFIHKKDTSQIMAENKQQRPNLKMPVERYKMYLFNWLIIKNKGNYNFDI